jgi:hypothetical protein
LVYLFLIPLFPNFFVHRRQSAAADLEELDAEIEESVLEYTALDGSGFHQPDDAFELYWGMRNWPATIAATMEDTRRMLARSHAEYLEELKLNQSRLLEDMEMLRTEVEQFVELGEMEAVDERLAIVQVRNFGKCICK